MSFIFSGTPCRYLGNDILQWLLFNVIVNHMHTVCIYTVVICLNSIQANLHNI